MRLFSSLRDPFVTVFSPSGEGVLALAKSLLESAGIPYQVRAEKTGDLIGWGRLGTGVNYVTGPVRVVVRPEDADVAREILSDLTEVRTRRISPRYRVIAAVFLLVPFAVGVLLEILSWIR